MTKKSKQTSWNDLPEKNMRCIQRILKVEKEYAHLNELSKQANEDIAAKLEKIIEEEARS